MSKLEANLLDALFDFDGPIHRAAFLTYTFDPEYFAKSIYPELARRGCERVVVLMDARKYQALAGIDSLNRAGRIVLERFPGGLTFHPKLSIVAGRGSYRCIVGSANLTQTGWESNKELFSTMSEQVGDTAGLIRFLTEVVSRLPKIPSASRVLAELADELRATMEWQEPNLSSRLVWNGLEAPRLWSALDTSRESIRAKEAVVLSPYFEAPERFESGLLKEWLEKGLRIDLFVPYEQGHSRVPRDEIKELKKQRPRQLRLYGVQTGVRILHGKLMALLGSTKAVMLAGSPNFTAGALQGKNVEAGLWFETSRAEIETRLKQLLFAEAREIDADALPEPDPATELTLQYVTGFLVSAVLDLYAGSLRLSLDRPWAELTSAPEKPTVEIAGQVVPAEFLTVHGQEIAIQPASRWLRDENGSWHLGQVLVRTNDGSARDWRLIELAPGPAISETGGLISRASNLEEFIAFHLNPNLAVRGLGNSRDRKNGGGGNQPLEDFEDVEAGLDRAYRWAASLDAYFSYLMTDPYTVYQWRQDWLTVAHLIEEDKALQNIGKALIAGRLLTRLEQALSKDATAARAGLASDELLLGAISRLRQLAVAMPEFSAPTVLNCLQEVQQ